MREGIYLRIRRRVPFFSAPIEGEASYVGGGCLPLSRCYMSRVRNNSAQNVDTLGDIANFAYPPNRGFFCE